MKTIEIKKDIYWVGAVDWDVRDFHGYSTYKGTTYNAYLILDDKITLIDTVKKEFKGDLIHKIRGIIPPEKIDYIVVNHVEMDHTGCLPEIIDIVRPEKIICSDMGRKALIAHFHREDWPYHVVGSGDKISLGRRSLEFIETRMLHWPDSMFSYVPEEGLLFSNDAFGEHLASSERFDDEVAIGELIRHAAKYYANIILLYSRLVKKQLENLEQLGLKIDMIAPDHGLIWRSHTKDILEAYHNWCNNKSIEKALVIYDTMWHSTEMMAKAISDGIEREGVSVKLYNLEVNHRSDIMTEVLDTRAIVLGSPTLNNGILPSMAGFLNYMKGLKPGAKIGAAFGSYGWSGESVKIMSQYMKDMKFNIIEPGLRFQYLPTHEQLKECVGFGRRIGRAIKEGIGG